MSGWWCDECKKQKLFKCLFNHEATLFFLFIKMGLFLKKNYKFGQVVPHQLKVVPT